MHVLSGLCQPTLLVCGSATIVMTEQGFFLSSRLQTAGYSHTSVTPQLEHDIFSKFWWPNPIRIPPLSEKLPPNLWLSLMGSFLRTLLVTRFLIFILAKVPQFILLVFLFHCRLRPCMTTFSSLNRMGYFCKDHKGPAFLFVSFCKLPSS